MSYIAKQMPPAYDAAAAAGYDHSETFEPEYTGSISSSGGDSLGYTHTQCEAYAMCSRCYTQQDCPHRHTAYRQGLPLYGMMPVPIGYPRHDPPLSSVGAAAVYNGNNSNNSNSSSSSSSSSGRSQKEEQFSLPHWYDGVHNLVTIASSPAVMRTPEIVQQAQQQQNTMPVPCYGQFTGGYASLGAAMTMTSSDEESLFPHGMHGLPDLFQRTAGTVAPSALERYPPADDYAQYQQQQQQDVEEPLSPQSQPPTSSLVAVSTSASSTSSSSSSCSSSVASEMITPRTHNHHQPTPVNPSGSSSSSTSDITYHRALYGSGAPADPSSPRAIVNRQILPIIAAQHGHPVWPLDTKAKKNTYLLEAKRRGVSYRDIKEYGEIPDAESTLRGRYRMLTKSAEERVRRPVWEPRDLQLLHYAVQLYTDGRQRKRRDSRRLSTSTSGYSSEDTATTEPRISWKAVAEYIARNGGSYKFGYATCKKKWEEVNFTGPE
ncbi:hypothetical protein PISL3812_09196 [Talaromyces islandicus]|uniref:Myb-like domain-containing protein n=1 Tax=Talaromyces islandicus TaxID=28573 RepID=A0A0U1MAZ0_TALIS|nr:hypothetical protein PISL3812_09196 [Talaromyces islandicus]